MRSENVFFQRVSIFGRKSIVSFISEYDVKYLYKTVGAKIVNGMAKVDRMRIKKMGINTIEYFKGRNFRGKKLSRFRGF